VIDTYATTARDSMVARVQRTSVRHARVSRAALVAAFALALLGGRAIAQQPFTDGTSVIVVVDSLRVREAPALSAAQVGSQRRGARGVVADRSPYWADGYWWWKIAYADGVVGWSADGDSTEAFLEASTSAANAATTRTPPMSQPGSGAGSSAAALVERAFWSGELPLACAGGPPAPDLFEADRLPLIDHCAPTLTTSRDVDDVFMLESMAVDSSTRAGADVVATVETAGATLVAVSYFNTFETGVRGVQRLMIYRLDGTVLRLVGRLHSERGYFHFLDAGGVAHIVSPSGDRVFESNGGDFVLRPGLSYRADDLERMRRNRPETSWVVERRNAVRRLTELEGNSFGGPPRERSTDAWVRLFFTGDLMVDCRNPSLRWDAGGRFDLATTRCLDPVYAGDLPSFEDVHLGSVIIAGTVKLAAVKKDSIWIGDHLITLLVFHDANKCYPEYPCRLLIYQHAPDGYEGLLGILSAESNVTWFNVDTGDQGAIVRATEHIFVPGDEEGPSLGIEQTYAIHAAGVELLGRETVIFPGSHLDRLLTGELRSLGSTTEDVNRAVNEVIDLALTPGLTSDQRRERVTQMQSSWGAELLATAVRFVPVYDDRSGSWQSFDAWSRQQVGGSGSDAPFTQDPVGSTVRMLFDPSLQNISRQLGIDLGW
jgi:hypothetical protein